MPQHSPLAQSAALSQSVSIMQSYITEFQASPVTMRNSKRRELPKFVKLASWFRFSPNLTLPKRFIPRMAYTKQSRNISAPMFSKPGREMIRVLNSMRKPVSFFTTLKILARRRMRKTEAAPPPPAMKPIRVMATQKKSKQFHRLEKYAAGYMAYSFAAASKVKMIAKNMDRPSSVSVQASLML